MGEKYKYLFGPVSSRRLGSSLGVDVIPYKHCTYDCVYCQLGRTGNLEVERQSFFDPAEILGEVRRRLFDDGVEPDYITFSGSGEPTLNVDIGALIEGIKEVTNIPVSVLTNGSLLWIPEVRESLLTVDLVVPSMDALVETEFLKVNRPHEYLVLEKIRDGIVKFSREYKGQLWLEILLVKNLNDSDENIDALLEFASQVKPDRIHLNTVVRPPVEGWASPLDDDELGRIAERFGEIAEVVSEYRSLLDASKHSKAGMATVVDLLKRRPCSAEEIKDALSIHRNEVAKFLRRLEEKGVLEKHMRKSVLYYNIRED